MLYKNFKSFLGIATVCAIIAVLAGCKDPENTKKGDAQTVSDINVVANLGDSEPNEGDSDTYYTYESSDKENEYGEGSSDIVEIEPEGPDAVPSGSDDAQSPPNVASSDENLWDSDGDGYYDIKVY